MWWLHQFAQFVMTVVGGIGPFFAVLLGGAVTLIGVFVAQRGEEHRARSQHERERRTATADRLRELYAPYVALSNAMNDLAGGWQISIAETNETKQARLRDVIHSAWADADKVNARVALEAGSSGVKNAAHELRKRFNIFELTLQNIAQLAPSQWSEQMNIATADLQGACNSMVDEAVAHIAKLEERH